MTSNTKSNLRQQAKEFRLALNNEFVEKASKHACELVISTNEFAQAKSVLIYYPIKNEISPLPLIEASQKAGKTIALANKETLVAAGHIVMDLAAKHHARILPVDSEHSAIFQCLMGSAGADIDKIHLTASGGPFRTWSREDIAKATPAQALNHPNWSMGSKITIDSATMMNKGLEIIEAR